MVPLSSPQTKTVVLFHFVECTLTSNHTTLIFDMMGQIESTPVDYQALLAGLLPEYLHDEQAIDARYTVDEWRDMAHANPYVEHLQKTDMESREFSKLIRQALPKSD